MIVNDCILLCSSVSFSPFRFSFGVQLGFLFLRITDKMHQQHQHQQHPYNGQGHNINHDQDYNTMYNGNNYSQGYNPAPYNSGYDQGSYNQQGQYYPQPYGGSPPYQNQHPMSGYNNHYNHGPAPSRGGMYPPRGGYSRGGGLGSRGRLSRKRKPFVGGTLESQREWESQTACCFFLQGVCRYGDRCRFLHDNRPDLKCQFGDKCQKGHNDRGNGAEENYEQAPAEDYQSNERDNLFLFFLFLNFNINFVTAQLIETLWADSTGKAPVGNGSGLIYDQQQLSVQDESLLPFLMDDSFVSDLANFLLIWLSYFLGIFYMSETPVLLDLGSTALAHQGEVDEVKKRLGVHHNYFDCWIYGFLENKNFDIDEAVAKLKRREEFEKTDLNEIEITDWMMESMRQGIIQVIGNDKEGRVALYVYTARDKPSKAHRLEARKNFDMFVSYATRLRAESKRCQLVMLINQDKASVFGNVDMSFQADIALRIAKYYPGCVDKMYICKMNGTLAAFAKPVFSRLPAIVSDRIKIISAADIQNGKLLELFDEDVLPVALGGKNECDDQRRYDEFATTIKDYFSQLQGAISSGLGVKEWELMNLRNAGCISDNVSKIDTLRKNFNESNIFANKSITSGGDRLMLEDSGTEQLHTCDSYDGFSATTIQIGKQNIMTSTDFMESTENFFRVSITEGYDREWMEIVKAELLERVDIERRSGQLKNESLLAPLPPSVRLCCRGFLWLCMTVMSIFFLVGSLFVAVLGITNMTYLFFSTLYAPYYIFPYGIALAVTTVQFTIFVSRGFELTTNVYNGELILPLKAFGNRAHIFQVSICIICVVAAFIIFCITASRYGASIGFQFSFSFGWFVAACLTFIYHVLFAFGFKEISRTSYADGSRVNNAETTIYLFLDVALDSHVKRRPTTEIIAGCVLAMLSFAFGLSFIFSGRIAFLCCCIVAHSLLYFVTVISTFIGTSTASSNAALNSAFFGSLVWMNAVFALSQFGNEDGWGSSVGAGAAVALVFLFSSFSTLFGIFRNRWGLWALRITWMQLIVLHLGCLITLIVMDYKTGIFASALAIHLLVCAFRANEATNHYGIFCMTLGFTVLLLLCSIMGNVNSKEWYDSSVSDTLLPDYHDRYSLANTINIFAPLCKPLISTSVSDTMNIVGVALFAKLGYNYNSDAQRKDLQTWFPDYTVLGHFASGSENMRASVFRSSSQKITIIAMGGPHSLSLAINGVTMWIETYPLSLLNFVMPSDLLMKTLKYIVFLKDLAPLPWKKSLAELKEYVGEVACQYSVDDSEHVYIFGHGSLGVAASTVWVSLPCSANVVVFSTPTTIISAFSLSESRLAQHIIDVTPTSSFFSSWEQGPLAQVFPCARPGKCDMMDQIVEDLTTFCTLGKY
eukprot:gene3590-2531_t